MKIKCLSKHIRKPEKQFKKRHNWKKNKSQIRSNTCTGDNDGDFKLARGCYKLKYIQGVFLILMIDRIYTFYIHV